MWEHLIGPGPVKAGLEVVDHIVPGSTRTLVEGIEHFQNSPAYIHHRVEQAQDFWDDHKDDVEEFFDNVGDAVNNGLDAAGDFLGNAVDAIGDNLGDIVGSLFS